MRSIRVALGPYVESVRVQVGRVCSGGPVQVAPPQTYEAVPVRREEPEVAAEIAAPEAPEDAFPG